MPGKELRLRGVRAAGFAAHRGLKESSMLTILVPLLIAVVGALAYGLSANSKVGELGKICFAAGMFAICFAMTGHAVHLF